MFKFMIGSEEEGRYAPAFTYAREAILAREPRETAERAGVAFDEAAQAFRFESFGQSLTVSLPDCRVTFAGTDDIPTLEWRLCALHYLATADGAALSGELIHFRKMPGGNPYEPSFRNRSINILKGTICDKPVENVKKACEALGGRLEKSVADVQVVFDFAPRFPITVQIWAKDEEMEGNANVLFDSRAGSYLPTEDMVVTASVISRFLMKTYYGMFPQ